MSYCYCSWYRFQKVKIALPCVLRQARGSQMCCKRYWSADKSLARPGRKQTRKHVRDTRDFNNIETRDVIKVFFSCKARRRRKFTPFWQKHQLVSFLVGLRTYQHPCTISHISTKSRRELSSRFFLQGKAPKEIHAILTETLACFLPGRAKDLSAPLYYIIHFNNIETRAVIKFIPARQGAEGNSRHSDTKH